jgi:hypothetical protein
MMPPTDEALALLKDHQHFHVWLEGKPSTTWDQAQELVNAGYAQWGFGSDGRSDARGIDITNRGRDWLKGQKDGS